MAEAVNYKEKLKHRDLEEFFREPNKESPEEVEA